MRAHPALRSRPPRSALLVLSLTSACAAAAPVASTTPVAASTDVASAHAASSTHAPIAAFVIASTTETVIVPVDPAEPATTLPDLWILDDAVSPPVVRRVSWGASGELAAPPCPCPEIEGACRTTGPFIDVIRPGEPVPALPGSDCVCVTDQEAPCETPDYAVPEDSGTQYDPTCACGQAEADGVSADPVSLVGGAIHFAGDGHEGSCAGYNIYFSSGYSEELLDTHARTYPERDVLSCDPGAGGVLPAATRGGCVRGGAIWSEGPGEGDNGEESEYCWPCADLDLPLQAQVEIVARGTWWRVGWSFMTDGATVEEVALSPERCPGPADPCGDPARFPALEEPIADGTLAWWVATDSSAALYETGWQVALARPGLDEPVRVEDASLADALGVRFHADVWPILDAYRRALGGTRGGETLGADAVSCVEDDDCSAGTLCDGWLCHPACTDDASCWVEGICGVFCHAATGRCLRWSEGHCDDEDRVCPPGEDCNPTGDCVAWEGTLAPEDADFVDRRGGRGWGNRCFEHLGAGNLEAAQAACLRGLDVVELDTVRAAILYNLGLIAEARGLIDVAIELHAVSLELRENATVREHLETLRPSDAGAYGDYEGAESY